MRNLHLVDLLLGLRNLATERKADLLLSSTGKVYAKKLAKQQVHIEALPEVFRGGRPLAQQLAEKDDFHDGLGEAIYLFNQAILCLPIAPEALKADAQKILDTFVPALSILRKSYADEAAAATRKRPALEAHKDTLQSIAVPFPEGKSLYDWVSAFLDTGDELEKLLQDRALASNEGLSEPAAKVRSATLGLLSRFRAALADEIEEDTSLPRDLETRVFGYLDQLQDMRAQAAAGRKRQGNAEPDDQSIGARTGG